jgi:hypothetical protein
MNKEHKKKPILIENIQCKKKKMSELENRKNGKKEFEY